MFTNNFVYSAVRCWCMAIVSNSNKKTGCCTSQMAEEHTGHLMERQDNTRRGQSQNWTTNHGQHTERKTILLAWTCFPYGPPVHTAASTVLAGTRIQERTGSTKSKLEEYSKQRPTKDGVHLGGSRGGSSLQIRIASESNVSSWMRDESRSRSRSLRTTFWQLRYIYCRVCLHTWPMEMCGSGPWSAEYLESVKNCRSFVYRRYVVWTLTNKANI